MTNASKNKGTKAETAVVKFLQAHGLAAQRRALTGSKDCGDVEYGTQYSVKGVLEVKCGKQTANYSRKQKEEWLRQTKAEEVNSGLVCRLVIVRYNRSLKDAEVWSSDGGSFMYLDEFVEHLQKGKR